MVAELETFSLHEILTEPLDEEAPWVIKDFLFEGLTMLVGPSKIGKSWLCLAAAISVSSGTPFLGFETQQSGVLYLALEDVRRRIKTRAWRLVEEHNGPLDFATHSETVSSGLVEQLESYVKKKPKTKLVIIDTLQMIRGMGRDSGSAYASDYRDLSSIKKFADQHKIAVMVVHHTRKMGDADVFATVSGTNGIMGCADATMLIGKADRANGEATLFATGRDREYFEARIRLRECQWELVEILTAEQAEERKVPGEILQIVEMLQDCPGGWSGTARQLIEDAGINDEITPAVLGKRLAEHMPIFVKHGFNFRQKRTSNARTISFVCEDPEDEDHSLEEDEEDEDG